MPLAEINIVSTHFPIKAYWNKILFNDTCRNGSVFTSVHPEGWWDTAGIREELNSTDSLTFYQSQFFYLKGSDTVNVYWAAFSDSTILSVGINELTIDKNVITIFPNPFSNKVNVSVNNNELSEILLYDISSRKLLQQKFTNSVSLNISQLAKGFYIFEVRNENGVIKKEKVVKE